MEYYRADLIVEFCKNKRVLHIGAANSPGALNALYHIEQAKNGRLLHQKLQRVCSELIGIDVDRTAINTLKRFGINNIFYGDIVKGEFEVNFKKYNFNYILFPEVIHLLDNPGIALDNIKELMTTNTSLIITIPNVFAYTNIRTFICGKEYVHPDVMFWPSFKTMKKLFEFKNLKIDYFTYCSWGAYREVRTINRLIYQFILKRRKYLMSCMFFVLKLKP